MAAELGPGGVGIMFLSFFAIQCLLHLYARNSSNKMREIPFTYKFIKESLFELEAPLELLLVTGAMSRAQDEDAEMQLKRS